MFRITWITFSLAWLCCANAFAGGLPDIVRSAPVAKLRDSAFADAAAINPDHALHPWAPIDHEYDGFVFRPTVERPDTPVVVYFHGFDLTYHPLHVRTQLERYWAAGYIVVWLGAGESRWPSSSDKALATLRAALAQVASPAPRPVVFVAHSAGTLTAVETATKAIAAGVSLAGLVLHDPADGGFGAIMPPADASALPASLPLAIFVAATSASDSNATRVRNALFTTSKATHKAMWLVPHACVSERGASFDFTCPTFPANDVTLDDQVSATSRQYVSTHNQTTDLFGYCPNGNALCLPAQMVQHARVPSPRTQAAVFGNTLVCVDEMARRQPGDGCFGAAPLFGGTWSNGVDPAEPAAPLSRIVP